MSAPTTRPDGLTILAISDAGGWAMDADLATAAKRAASYSYGDTKGGVIVALLLVNPETTKVTGMGGWYCDDMSKGVPLAIGAVKVSSGRLSAAVDASAEVVADTLKATARFSPKAGE